MEEKPPCNKCIALKKRWGQEPDCKECLPTLMEENEEAFDILQKFRHTKVMDMGVSLEFIMDLYDIEDKIDVFEKVVAAWNDVNNVIRKRIQKAKEANKTKPLIPVRRKR